ncbi:NAD(P)H-dependent oxidoreductase [Alteromonas sp. 5E99-2]|uniref:FMN-dependent NADH-azoreductase n=1 Tax=Alteromonas sp. 5E99-2 TaxID=2817683 RepID=UPI001A989A7D|nr:NAD(P)H-dependent oxidoreductase [Alteromonas sp. 5E99-2]MBO1256469.1 NAD(P)H-dependent oxidoreductase [Alteromonas sp. 5E99-2]
MKVWHIDSSGRTDQSHSRRITKQFVDTLSAKTKVHSTSLDVSLGLPYLTDEMISSYFTPADQRTKAQNLAIVASNNIVTTAKASDIWVMGVPVYNFFAPASFKAFIDLLFRAKETFSYSESGPVGLLENKRVYVVIVSGGTEIGSKEDFLTPWLTHCLNFIGIKHIEFIKADKYTFEKDSVITQQIDNLTSSLSVLDTAH